MFGPSGAKLDRPRSNVGTTRPIPVQCWQCWAGVGPMLPKMGRRRPCNGNAGPISGGTGPNSIHLLQRWTIPVLATLGLFRYSFGKHGPVSAQCWQNWTGFGPSSGTLNRCLFSFGPSFGTTGPVTVRVGPSWISFGAVSAKLDQLRSSFG